MDPVAALRRAQEAISSVAQSASQGVPPEEVLDLIDEAQDALGDLSSWVGKGGFLPQTSLADRISA